MAVYTTSRLSFSFGNQPLRRRLLPFSEKSLIATYEAEARYSMTACKQNSCCLCHPRYDLTYRLNMPIVRFGPWQQHQFPNQYRTILNCPATCTTRNIIYTLTCPCQRVHYIDETSLSLPERLAFHQRHGNRIMQEYLLGEKNVARIRQEPKSIEVLTKDNMALYRHSTQCSFAMQWFLDENPEYWPFIPTLTNNRNDEEFVDNAEDVGRQLPSKYHFTSQQRLEMNRFFLEKTYLHTPNLQLDLYQAAIVAVLPYFVSDAVRRLIETLFITHTEAQLNSDGHLDRLIYPELTIGTSVESAQDQHCPFERLGRRQPIQRL